LIIGIGGLLIIGGWLSGDGSQVGGGGGILVLIGRGAGLRLGCVIGSGFVAPFESESQREGRECQS
jgi:hypothetical protein